MAEVNRQPAPGEWTFKDLAVRVLTLFPYFIVPRNPLEGHRRVWRICWIAAYAVILTAWKFAHIDLVFYLVAIGTMSLLLRVFARIGLDDGTALRCEWFAVLLLIAVSFSRLLLCSPSSFAVIGKHLCGIVNPPRLPNADWYWTLFAVVLALSFLLRGVQPRGS
jgi:hypothetical protein